MNSLTIMFVFMTAIVAAVGVAMAATPWIVRDTECFAVTIPPAAARDPRLIALKRRYAAIVLALTAALTIASIACAAMGVWERIGFIVATAGPLALIGVPFLLMLYFRRRVQDIKAAEGWRAERQVHVVSVGDCDVPHPVSLLWECLHLPLAGLTAALSVALMPYMPERVPIHYDSAGVADNWVDKGPVVVLMPAGIVLFLGVCMAFSHFTIVKSKRGTSPDAPAASAYGYALYARAQSMLLVGLGLAISALICLMPFNMAGFLSVDAFIGAVVLVIAASLAGSAWIYAVYGQNGHRAVRRLLDAAADGGMQVDDDRFWKLGVFYLNRDDPALFVPRRFGVGWSVNWGRPGAWGIIIGFAALVAAFAVGMGVLAG